MQIDERQRRRPFAGTALEQNQRIRSVWHHWLAVIYHRYVNITVVVKIPACDVDRLRTVRRTGIYDRNYCRLGISVALVIIVKRQPIVVCCHG